MTDFDWMYCRNCGKETWSLWPFCSVCGEDATNVSAKDEYLYDEQEDYHQDTDGVMKIYIESARNRHKRGYRTNEYARCHNHICSICRKGINFGDQYVHGKRSRGIIQFIHLKCFQKKADGD